MEENTIKEKNKPDEDKPPENQEKIDEYVDPKEGKDQNKVEEEDVPEDFFDDLLSNEFMDGLEVVDACDENESGCEIDNEQDLVNKEISETLDKKLESDSSVREKKADKSNANNLDKLTNRKIVYNKKEEGRYSREIYRGRRSKSLERSKSREKYCRYDKSRYSSKLKLYNEQNDKLYRVENLKSGDLSELLKNRERKSRENQRIEDKIGDISEYRGRDLNEKLKNREKKNSIEKFGQEDILNNIKDRRDPEKTKRDILRDKDKCAKVMEDKIITEKLRVAESGLVPPGMEMDFIHKYDDLGPFEVTGLEKSRRFVSSKTMEYITKDRSKSNDFSPKITTKAKLKSPVKSISPAYKSHIPKISPYRDLKLRRSRSPYIQRKRSHEDLRGRTRRSTSKRRHKSRSHDLLNMDRSKRTKNWPEKRSRSRNRSPYYRRRSNERSPKRRRESRAEKSPPRKKTRSFLEEIDEKLNIMNSNKLLEDIKLKLNPPPVVLYPNVPLHTQIPNPFQQPMQTVPPPMMQHNETFGSAAYHHRREPEPQSFSATFNSMAYPPKDDPPLNEEFFIGSSGPPPSNVQKLLHSNISPTGPLSNSEKNKLQDKEELDKLFTEKKITLTDYLAMATKSTGVSSVGNLLEKVKVLSRCEEAINCLTKDSNYNFGHFIPKTNNMSNHKPTEEKFSSPLRSIPVTRFQFTTPVKPEDTFKVNLKRLLARIGVNETEVNSSASPVFKTSTVESKKSESSIDAGIEVMSVSVPTQTEPYKCIDCEFRKKKRLESKLVQCNIEAESVCVQANPVDLEKRALESLLKNQSLASLTPAQLLAVQNMELKEAVNSSLGDKSTELQNKKKFEEKYYKGMKPWLEPNKAMRHRYDEDYDRFHNLNYENIRTDRSLYLDPSRGHPKEPLPGYYGNDTNDRRKIPEGPHNTRFDNYNYVENRRAPLHQPFSSSTNTSPHEKSGPMDHVAYKMNRNNRRY